MHSTVDEYLGTIDLEEIIYVNRIPLNKVVTYKLDMYNPYTLRYREYWHDEMRKCIDGFWVEHNGDHKYVPGIMYFYGTHWHILLNKKGSKSKTKVKGSPTIRDLEWIKSYLYLEARGFSGFAESRYTCHRDVGLPEEEQSGLPIPESCYNKDGSLKEYAEARDMLRDYHTKDLGEALFDNQALNVIDLESRGTGKSYLMAAIVGHNYLFDGSQNYDEWMKRTRDKEPMVSESLVGAGQSKYSADTLSKVQYGLDNLKGEYAVGKKIFPPPLFKATSGSWEPGKTVLDRKKRKIGGNWTKVDGSKIQHRSFMDNEFAANGTRASFNVIDEVGFMGNLLAALVQLKECTANSAEKFGVIWMTGTGGDMEGGSTLAAQSVFYDPAANSCVSFLDAYEQSNLHIGFFVPAWMGLNQFKDDLGNTDVRAACSYLFRVRTKLKNAKDRSALNGELCQRPIIPSEVFLISGGNIFPVALLKDQLNFLTTNNDPKYIGVDGSISMTPEGKIIFKPDLEGELQACDYPVKAGKQTVGCITIWEQPTKEEVYGLYLGGLDPYDHDQAAATTSLGSMFIMKRSLLGVSGHTQIVAEYTGRPELAKEFYENCRMLCEYYGLVGTMLYENEKMGIKTHFENRFATYLLAPTPNVLKANVESKVDRKLGQHMSPKVKPEVEKMSKDWLLEPSEDGKLNLHYIFSVPLLKELIYYDSKRGNFDRAIAFMLCVLQETQMYTVQPEEVEDEEEEDDFFSRYMFVNQQEQ